MRFKDIETLCSFHHYAKNNTCIRPDTIIVVLSPNVVMTKHERWSAIWHRTFDKRLAWQRSI